MPARIRVSRFVSAVVLLVVIGWLPGAHGAAAEPPAGVEVRLAARLLDDGRTEVALQYYWNNNWSPRVHPVRRYLPADAGEDRWLVSAPVRATSFQTQVRLAVEHPRWDDRDGPGEFELRVDGQRFRSNCRYLALSLEQRRVRIGTLDDGCEEETGLAENRLAIPGGQGRQDLRVAARRSGGRVQLAVQHREGERWSEPLVPSASMLPRQPSVGRWYLTFSVVVPVPPPAVSGQLHRAASLSVVEGEFQIDTGDRRFRSNCGALELRAAADAIEVDTRDPQCAASTALATICGPDVPAAQCDRQRNHAYQWENARLRLDGAHTISLDLEEAQQVVDAVYGDYFPHRPNPPRVVRTRGDETHYDGARHRIQLADWAMRLDVVLHETAHALLRSGSVDDPGHGARYLALLLALWERYLPVVDIETARGAARSAGLDVADSPLPLMFRTAAASSLRTLLCVQPARSERLCRALAGELDAGPETSATGRFGGRLDDLWWLSGQGDDAGAAKATVVRESRQRLDGESVARLSISCDADDRLEVEIWWRGLESVSPTLSFRIGDDAWLRERWRTFSGGTWSGAEWAGHQAIDAASFLHRISWRAADAASLQVRFDHGRWRLATFNLPGLFETPLQPDLARCEADRPSVDPNALVVDRGSYGHDFWWGVDPDETPAKTYVVRDTMIAGSAQTARLSVQCEAGHLEIDVYWALDQDLDRTIHYRIGDGPVRSEEWRAGWGRWGDVEYKWTGAEGAAGLIAELAWAAPSGGRFTVEAHARGDAGRRYTAHFDLTGLFDTPVQPNLARCGR